MEEAAARTAPTYPDKSVMVEEARAAVRRALADHLEAGAGCRALRVSTGVGKTRIAVEVIAEAIRRQKDDEGFTPYFYAVPTLRLGDEVAELFHEAGVSARVFRGRKAPDPTSLAPDARMCLDIEAVDLAVQLGRDVKESCCNGINPLNLNPVACPFYGACSYQRQMRDHSPERGAGRREGAGARMASALRRPSGGDHGRSNLRTETRHVDQTLRMSGVGWAAVEDPVRPGRAESRPAILMVAQTRSMGQLRDLGSTELVGGRTPQTLSSVRREPLARDCGGRRRANVSSRCA